MEPEIQHPTLKAFREKYGALPKDGFVSKFPDPFLVIDYDRGKERSTDFITISQNEPGEKRMVGLGSDNERKQKALVAPLTKSDRNTFSTMITLGRASNNDVIVRHESVSKFHAFFRRDPASDSLTVWDAGSTYGTTLEGKKLRQGEAGHLKSGITLMISEVVQATFLSSLDFYDYLKLTGRLG